MSKQIDERVVSMRFDNSKFEKNAKDSISTLDKLKQSLDFKGASKGLEDVDKAAKKVDVSGISKGVEKVQAKFSALEIMAVTALANITNQAVNTGKRLASAFTIDPLKSGFSEYELKMGSVQTIMAGTGEDLQTVMKYLEELNVYADKTIYSFSDMTTNIGKFTNAGVSLDKAVAAIQGVSNVAAVSGANAQEASRAMYNFAQALSAGYVKLIDWKSIENANMATVEFKNQLIETAVACGTVSKASNGMYKTLKGNTFDATHNFNDVLQDQWMTTDVLIQTLNRYADETTDIGKKAFSAAQDVKTFTQMMDTLKEAAGSGWATTWELIFGDFNEAKELWTMIGNIFGDIINKSAEARNSFLNDSLSRKWELFSGTIEDAGVSIDDFKTVMYETARESGIAIDDIIADAGYLEQALRNDASWFTPELIDATLQKLVDGSTILGDLTDDQVSNLKELQESASDADSSFNKLIRDQEKPGGQRLLVYSLKYALEGLLKVLETVKGAFRDVFPKATPEELYDLLYSFNKFCASLIMSDETADKLRRTLTGLFSIFKMVTDVLNFGLSIALKIISRLLGVTSGRILDVTAVIGDHITALREWISHSTLITGIINNFVDGVVAGLKYLKALLDKFMQIPVVAESVEKLKEGVVASFTKISDVISGATAIFLDFLTRIKNADPKDMGSVFKELLKNLKEYFTNIDWSFEELIKAFQNLWKEMKAKVDLSWLTSTKDTIVNVFDSIISYIKSIDIKAVLAAMIGVGIYKFSKQLGSALDSFTSIATSFANVAKSISGVFDGFKKEMKANVIKTEAEAFRAIAVGILILAASLWVISKIDEERLLASIGVLAVLIGTVAAMMVLLHVLSKGSAIKAAEVSKMFASISLFLMAIANSMILIALIPVERMKAAALVIAVMITIMLGFIAGLLLLQSKFHRNKILQVQSTILALSASMILMSLAMAIMAAIPVKRALFAATQMIVFMGVMLLMMAYASAFRTKDIAKFGSIFVGFGASLLLMASAMWVLAFIPVERAALAIYEIMSLMTYMATLTAILKAVSGDIGKVGAMMISLGGSLLFISLAIRIIAGIKQEDIVKSVAVIAALTAVFAGFFMLAKWFGSNGSWKLMLGVATAITILSISLVLLSSIKLAPLAKAVAAITVLLAGLALVIASTQITGQNGRVAMTQLAVVIGILCSSLIALSLLPSDKITKACEVLTFVMLSLGAVIASMYFMDSKGVSTKAFAQIMALITMIGGLVWLVSRIPDANGAISAAIGASILMMTVGGLLVIMEKLDTRKFSTAKLTKVGSVMLALIAFMLLIMLALVGISAINFDPEKLTILVESMIKVIITLTLVTAAIALLSKLNINIGAAAQVIGIMAMILAVWTAIMAVFGVIAGFDGAMELFEKGGQILSKVGYYLGEFFGSIIGGFGTGMSSGLPEIGQNLSDFMTNAKPFFDGLKGIKKESIDILIGLAGGLLMLTADEILNGLASLFGGGQNIVDQFKELGEGLFAFALSIAKMPKEAIAKANICAEVVKKLAEAASSIPNQGGLLAGIVGDNKMDEFAEQFEVLAEGITAFGKSEYTIDNAVKNKATIAADIVKIFSEAAKTIPNQTDGSFIGSIMGSADLDKFANEFETLAEGITKFEESSGFDSSVLEKADMAGSVVETLSEAADGISNSGGFWGWLCGDNDLGDFAEKLPAVGQGISDFCKKLDGVSNWDDAVSAIGIISTINDGLELNANSTNLNLYAGYISDLGTAINEFVTSVGSVFVTSGIQVAASNFQSLVTSMMNAGLTPEFTSRLGSFASSLATLGDTGIQSFINTFAGLENINAVAQATNIIITTVVETLNSNMYRIGAAFRFIVQTACAILTNEAVLGMMRSAGEQAINGFINGLLSKLASVRNAGLATGQTLVNAVKTALDINSPSRVFYEIGEYAGLGLVNGMNRYSSVVEEAGSEIGESAVNGLKSTIVALSDAIDSDLDTQPTIRPVLDLSDVANGAGKLNSMLSRSQALSISSGMNSSTNGIQNGTQIAASGGNNITFTQNNYSPRALSRAEIYRQTRNQFSVMERMVTK